MSHVDLWGRTFKLEETSGAEALGQEHKEVGSSPELDLY